MKNFIPVIPMVRTIFLSAALILLITSVKAQNNTIFITAHRGASGHAPENTIAAVETAIRMGADYIEIDVQETADGEIILLHDGNLKRTTGMDKNIWETTYSEIKDLEAGSWYGKEFSSEKIPLLKDVIEYAGGKVKFNIELKTNGHEKQLAERTVKIINEMDFRNECILTSFSYEQVKRIKESDSAVAAGLIFSRMPLNKDIFTDKYIDILSVHHSLVDEKFMQKVIKAGKDVHVWTVNDEEEMHRLIKLGVKNIITNYPDKLKAILENEI